MYTPQTRISHWEKQQDLVFHWFHQHIHCGWQFIPQPIVIPCRPCKPQKQPTELGSSTGINSATCIFLSFHIIFFSLFHRQVWVTEIALFLKFVFLDQSFCQSFFVWAALNTNKNLWLWTVQFPQNTIEPAGALTFFSAWFPIFFL